MKIAIATDWFAPRRGGIERQLRELSERLGSRGHDVEVLTSTPGSNDAPSRVRRLQGVTLPGTQLALSPTLPNVLRQALQRRYDVVHSHVSVVSPVGYTAAFVSRSMGIPTIVTFHSVLRAKVHILRAANAVAEFPVGSPTWTAVSAVVAGQVRRALNGVGVDVLPNGVNLGFWGDAGYRTTRTHNDAITLVSTMRLHRKKRPLQLLRAFALAARRVSARARLLVVGDGPERSIMEREIHELGIAGGRVSVEMLGWRDAEFLRLIYANADGFVLASKHEAFGIAALEARAAGLPVIAMAASGSREFLRDDVDALLCHDDADLIASIARFIADADLRSRLANAPVDLMRYDWTAVLDAHERAYECAITRGRDLRAADAR